MPGQLNSFCLTVSNYCETRNLEITAYVGGLFLWEVKVHNLNKEKPQTKNQLRKTALYFVFTKIQAGKDGVCQHLTIK